MSIRLHGFLPHQALPGAISVPSGRGADRPAASFGAPRRRSSANFGRSLPPSVQTTTASRNAYHRRRRQRNRHPRRRGVRGKHRLRTHRISGIRAGQMDQNGVESMDCVQFVADGTPALPGTTPRRQRGAVSWRHQHRPCPAGFHRVSASSVQVRLAEDADVAVIDGACDDRSS